MEKRFSRISISKAHIFDHSTGKTVCGAGHGWIKPNKTMLNAREMLSRHKEIAKKRGGENPHKWSCVKCEKKMEKIIGETK